MMKEKKDVEEGGGKVAKVMAMPVLPKPLTLEEKKYLLAVERGDMANVRRILQRAHRKKNIDINCVDSFGRGALTLAIDGENLEMVELLIVMGVETKDALLLAINAEFVEAVELLLEHEELIHKPNEPYSWQKVDYHTAMFTPDITPLMLAAHRNNYEIIKILLDRGATLPDPHDIRCGCDECVRGSTEDPLRHSLARLNEYRALASPSLIALSSTDPILTAFRLSWELRNMAFGEQESKSEYLELRRQVQKFAVDLLDQSRSSQELNIILNYDPDGQPLYEGDHMKLARLELAIDFKQKKICPTAARASPYNSGRPGAYSTTLLQLVEMWVSGEPTVGCFQGLTTVIDDNNLDRRLYVHSEARKLNYLFVAHPNIQQLLASIWYEGVPGFRRKSSFERLMIIFRVALLFPFYCCLYMVAPNCSTGRLMRKPFMKFLIHASSYLFFLLILILVSLRAEEQIIHLFGPDWMVQNLEQQLLEQRGNGPTYLEMIVAVYVLGFIYQEAQEMYVEGMRSYLRNLWNFIDFTRNSMYVAVAILRIVAYFQQAAEIEKDPQRKFVPREDWHDYDPQLIAEGLFAGANVFSALKLVHLFSINPHLGPLQISLGRMVIDIVKFFFIYTLVLFAFACGLNQLLWYFADLERRKCYVLPGGLPDWNNAGDHCMKWRSFGNVFEASQSLFWASFGMVGLENFELAGIKSYTRFWGLLMFGSYSVINVIVLLNLLIAMMSNSYAMIDEHSDVEWKFARTRLWMSYFEEISTLPPPFNILPTPKLFMKLLRLRKKDRIRNMKLQEGKESEQDIRYTAVMRALVWRYVAAMHRKMDDEPVTEDDVNELKGDVSALRYELLEVLGKNGMDVSFTDRKEKTVLAKRMKVWERRLMADFRVAPIKVVEDDNVPANEDSLAKFRRIAKMAVAASSNSKWDQTLAAVGVSSQIGRCRTRNSVKNQQNLQRAIDEAKRLVQRSPLPDSRGPSPIEMPISPGHTLKELIRDISTDYGDPVIIKTPVPGSPRTADGKSLVVGTLLHPKAASGTATPRPGSVSPTPSELVSRAPSPAPRSPTPKPVARPTAAEIKPPEGALPPPPANSKSKAITPPKMEFTPSTPVVVRASPLLAENSARSPTSFKSRSSGTEPSTASLSPPVSPTSATQQHPTTSSIEQLLPPSPPPLPTKTENKSLRRQPKYGWI